MNIILIWLGIAVCLIQSAIFSGLNLAVFSLSRLRLESAAQAGDVRAGRVIALRRDANFTLVTIIGGNVAVNVLLTLLSESILAGVAAFFFSTVMIIFIGEIIPQALFSRHALRVAASFSPLIRFYQILLWPLARPIGKLLDAWVGKEEVPWFREQELRNLLQHHARDTNTEISKVEATGAINFIAFDDLAVRQEGEPLDPKSIIRLSFENGFPVFPAFKREVDDPFLHQLAESGKKWIVITDFSDVPHFVLNSHAFLRGSLWGQDELNFREFYHRPLIVNNGSQPLGKVLSQLTVKPEEPGDDVIDEDLILVWTAKERRIITGSDILGRLFRGIAEKV